MKTIIVLAAALITAIPTIASADGRRGHPPDRYSDRYDRGSRTNPWPFIAGAIVGGIIIHEVAEANQPRVVTSDAPVLVNGVWMQRTYSCVQEIVTNYRGDQSIVNRCNYVYVPVQVSER
jgi:hypothetical protein